MKRSVHISINFEAVRDGRSSYADATRDLAPASLRATMSAIFDTLDGLLRHLTDAEVIFQPVDPAANDTFAAPGADATLAWTLGHVVVHLTAGLEENAALGATLARGVEVQGRSRYEVPWESVHSAGQISARLTESRRICAAFLAAWPDEPHLELTVDPIPRYGPMNAIGRTALGIFHAEAHLQQLREIRQQAAALPT